MKNRTKCMSLFAGIFVLLFLICFSFSVSFSQQESSMKEFANYNELYGIESVATNQLALLDTKSGVTNLKQIVVFIEFADSDTLTTNHLDSKESVANAETIYNSDYFSMDTVNGVLSVPSFKSYFKQQSYGKLLIDTEIFPKQSGVVESYRASHPMGYYQKYSSSNPIGYKTSDESLKRETELVNEAVLAVKSQVEAKYSGTDLDFSNDGIVDAISFVVEGLEAGVASVGWGDMLWSHKLDNPNITATISGKRVVGYNLLYGYDYTKTAGLFSLNHGTYGTIIHEFGHTLGFSDLYRHGASAGERPVGFFDVMGNVIGSNPQSFLSYFVTDYYRETNWHQPLSVIKSTQTVTLTKPKYLDSNEKRAVKIQLNDGNDKEYFILEYHDKMNTYADSSADESGVIVYRVNEKNKGLGNNGNGSSGAQDLVYVFRPSETVLGAAKGELSKATLNTKRPTLGKNITIGNTTFDGNTIYYSDGTNSGLVIQVTGQTSDSITVEVRFPTMNGTGTKTDPYLIHNAETFLFFMNRNTTGKYYKLVNDIDFSSVKDYPAIEFAGYLDGNNKTFKNITTNGTGVFKDIGGFSVTPVVENLMVENIRVNPSNGDYLGGFSSIITNGIIRNVHMKSGSVENISHAWNTSTSTGGFSGNVSDTTTITNCSSSLNVSSEKNVGGFIGLNMNATIQNSFSNGSVSGQSNVGAFIGVQSIHDQAYHIPQNVFYHMNNKTLNSVGGYDNYMHDSSLLPIDSLGKGIVGISVPVEITGKENDMIAFSVETKPVRSLAFSFQSSDTSVATYENGKIHALKAGTSNITTQLKVGTNFMSFKTKVTVQSKPVSPVDITSIVLDKTSASMNVGATLLLKGTINPSNTTMSKTITWSSNHSDIASVDQTGKVTAKKVGTAVITATSVNGKKASATITVTPKPVDITSIVLDKTSASMNVGATLLLKGTINPSNTTMSKTITWSSNHSDIASVDQTGKVTAKKVGTAVITATSVNGKKASATITVTQKSTTITETDVLKSFGLIKKEGYVFGFTLGAKVEDVRKKLSSNSAVKLVNFQNASNQSITTGIISTNMKFTLQFNQKEYHYIVVIKGDVNGDGMIYATDYVKVKNHIMGKSKLTGAYYMAADINQDKQIYATDYMKIKNHIMGKSKIEQV